MDDQLKEHVGAFLPPAVSKNKSAGTLQESLENLLLW